MSPEEKFFETWPWLQTNWGLYKLGFRTYQVIINYFSTIKVLVVIFVLSLMSLLVAKCIRRIWVKKVQIGKDLGRKLKWIFFFSIYLWYFVEMFLFLLIITLF